ncbi:MAG TPA: hydrogenase maturation protease [Acidobacteriota bacterium]|nr:hydrogenase maturation protease [Acidobacteriota bacterium]
MRILVLGLGNELLADDAVGLLAARELRAPLDGQADVVESSLSGVALIELLLGYDCAILIDAVQTGDYPPGTIREFTPADLDSVIAPSPHYAGIPELIALASQLDLDFPDEIRIYAMEIADACSIGGALTDPVRAALGKLVDRVKQDVCASQKELCHA